MDLLHEQGDSLPLPWAAAIGAKFCAVLTVAHAESLIHRDPQNPRTSCSARTGP